MWRKSLIVVSILAALVARPASARGGHGGGGHAVQQAGAGQSHRAAHAAKPGGRQHVARQHVQHAQGHANVAARRAQGAARHAEAAARHASGAVRHEAAAARHAMAAERRSLVVKEKRHERGVKQRVEVRVRPERIARGAGPRGLGRVERSVAGPRRFRGLDVNADGVVTRAEWRGNNRSFANHDWNGDGILDGNEVIPGAGRGRVVKYVDRVPFFERFLPLPRRFVAPVPLGLAVASPVDVVASLPGPDLVALPPLSVAFPFRLDVPQLQSVVRVQGFRPVDLIVTRPAVLPLDRVLLGNDFVALDVNRDRFVTLSEWTGPSPLFWRLDTNRDRRIVYTELVAPTYVTTSYAPAFAPLRSAVLVGRDRYVQFDLLDRTNDGLIAPWEWSGDMDLFFLLDRNGDGLLEQPEFLGVGVVRPVVPVRMVVNGALDLDHDGYVSRWEWVGDPFRFVALDLNGNGRVGRVEAVIGTAI